jgi:N-acetylglucosaminyl-diphospho-decaprenol L-rhamnosyltransferase
MVHNAIVSGSLDSAPNELDAGVQHRVLEVAVVIVTYKSARLTIENLRSLQADLAIPWLRVRAIVVDNASGDLPEITQAIEENGWSWATAVAAPKNGGFGYGNNLGIERAFALGNPSYLYLLNPDTQVRPGAIASLVRFLEGNPEVGIAGSSFEGEDGGDWPIAFRFPSMLGEIDQGLNFGFVSNLLRRWATVRRMSKENEPVDWISGASMMIRPGVFKALGGMDENYFLYFEETDFCTRARRAGFSTWYVPESRVMHIGGQSTSVAAGSSARLPSYWFESRRRYFAVTYGVVRAMMIDVVAVLAHSLGLAKKIVQGRREAIVPHFISDLLRHSILWKRNRNIPAIRSRFT